MAARTWAEMVDAIHRRFPGTTVDAVAAAVEAVDWVNKAGGIYSNYWGQVLRDEEAEDPGLFDPGLEALEEDEDPEDLLDELGLIYSMSSASSNGS